MNKNYEDILFLNSKESLFLSKSDLEDQLSTTSSSSTITIYLDDYSEQSDTCSEISRETPVSYLDSYSSQTSIQSFESKTTIVYLTSEYNYEKTSNISEISLLTAETLTPSQSFHSISTIADSFSDCKTVYLNPNSQMSLFK